MNIENFETPVLEVEEIETKDVITGSENFGPWKDNWNAETPAAVSADGDRH